jgi:hypothetical protein
MPSSVTANWVARVVLIVVMSPDNRRIVDGSLARTRHLR